MIQTVQLSDDFQNMAKDGCDICVFFTGNCAKKTMKN